MKTLKTLSASLALLTLAFAASAAPVAYPFRVIDNSGNPVAGATIAIGSTTLASGSATSVPAAAGEKVLTTNAAPGAAVSLTLLDYGTGDYAILSDPAVNGELYLPLVPSKPGSTITAGNALIALVASADPNNITTAATNTGTLITGQTTLQTGQTNIAAKTNLIATNAGDSPNQVNAQAGVTTAVSQTTSAQRQADLSSYGTAKTSDVAAVPGNVWTNGTRTVTGGTVASVSGSVGSVTGSVGSISGITFPSNFGTFAVDSSGRVTLVPGQSTAASNLPTDYQQRGIAVTLPATAPSGYGSGSGGIATLNTGDEAKLTAASTAQQAGQPVTLPSTVLSQADLTAVQQAIMTYALHTGVSFQKAMAQVYLASAAPVAPTKAGTVSTNPFLWPDGTTGQTSTIDSSTGARTETPGALPN